MTDVFIMCARCRKNTTHRMQGAFRSRNGDWKFLFKCRTCGIRRVYGAQDARPLCPEIPEEWVPKHCKKLEASCQH